MKLEQKPKFQPITITLETKAEAEALWEIVEEAARVFRNGTDAKAMAVAISNHFSIEAQL